MASDSKFVDWFENNESDIELLANNVTANCHETVEELKRTCEQAHNLQNQEIEMVEEAMQTLETTYKVLDTYYESIREMRYKEFHRINDLTGPKHNFSEFVNHAWPPEQYDN